MKDALKQMKQNNQICVRGTPEVLAGKDGRKWLKLNVLGGSVFLGLLMSYPAVKIGVEGLFTLKVYFGRNGPYIMLEGFEQEE